MPIRMSQTFITTMALLALQPTQAAGLEWSQWRGPNRDAVSRETGLQKSWKEGGPRLVWKSTGVGNGYASLAIVEDKIFTMGRKDKQDFLEAFALDGGKKLWSTPFAEGGDAPTGSPTVDGGLVFAISNGGELVCCNAADGKIVWQKNFEKDFGGKMMSSWGFSESPLIDGDRLLCTPGGNDAMIVALDKRTGETLWKSSVPPIGDKGGDGAGYSSIVISHACGVKQYVQMTGRGVISVDAKDGTFLWGYNKVANGTANIPTPIVKEDYIFCSTGYGTGSALLKIQKADGKLTAREEYFLDPKTLQNHHGGLILVGDYIYGGHGHNNGFPVCFELLTGKPMWNAKRGPGEGSAAVVYADGNLYFRYESGKMALIGADPEKYEVKGTFDIPKGGEPSWSHPVVLGGKLYLREQDQLLCYDIARQ